MVDLVVEFIEPPRVQGEHIKEIVVVMAIDPLIGELSMAF